MLGAVYVAPVLCIVAYTVPMLEATVLMNGCPCVSAGSRGAHLGSALSMKPAIVLECVCGLCVLQWGSLTK